MLDSNRTLPADEEPRTSDTAEQPARPRRPLSGRVLLFAAVCGLCVLVAGGYTVRAALRSGSSQGRPAGAPVADASTLAALREQPHLVFIEAKSNPLTTAGQVAVVPLD